MRDVLEPSKAVRWLSTATNFAFLANFAYGITKYAMLPAPRPWMLLIVSIGALLLGVGSFLFHWLLDRWARRFDEFGMYALFIPIAAWALHVAIGGPEWPWAIGSIVLVLLALRDLSRLNSFYVLAVLGAVIGTCLFLIGPWWQAAGIVAVFGAGIGLRSFPRPSEHGLRHAGWHLVAAAGIGLVIAFLAAAAYLSG